MKEKVKLTEGTSNFASMDNLPLLVFEDFNVVLENGSFPVEDDYETEEKYWEAVDKFYDDYPCTLLNDEEIDDLKEDIDNFNSETKDMAYSDEVDDEDYDTLKDIVVELKPGYYEAVQLYVKESLFEYLSESEKKRQLDRLTKFFDDMKKKYSLTELGVAYRFSNGETGYKKVESVGKTEMVESVKNRAELKKVLTELNHQGYKTSIKKSLKEGYKYDVKYFLKEEKEELVIYQLVHDGKAEPLEVEKPANLKDFVQDIVDGGNKDFELYSNMTNNGPFGIIAKVKDGEIVEFHDTVDEGKELKEAPIYDLDTQHDGRQSFYGKAKVDTGADNKDNKLYSYNTLVAEIKDGKPVVYGVYSQTTLRHIKEWLKQNGFKAETKDQILRDYGVKEESVNEKCGKKEFKKKNLEESYYADVFEDLVDRAKSWKSDGNSNEEAVEKAIDDGLIYNEDIVALADNYGVINYGDLISDMYEDLFEDILNKLDETNESCKSLEERNLTSSEKANRNADRVIQSYEDQNEKFAKFLLDNGVSEEEVEELKNHTGLGKNALLDKIVELGLKDKFFGKEETNESVSVDLTIDDEEDSDLNIIDSKGEQVGSVSFDFDDIDVDMKELDKEAPIEDEEEVVEESLVDYVETYKGHKIYKVVDEDKYTTNFGTNTLTAETVSELKGLVDDKELEDRKRLDNLPEGKELEEDVKIISSLSDYTPWSGAVSTWEEIVDNDLVDDLDFFLEEAYPDGLTMTELNDLLWFESDYIKEVLGLKEAEDEEEDE